jgi:hypothetical protein
LDSNFQSQNNCLTKVNDEHRKENVGTNQFQKVSKKIMGIRKTSSKPTVSENSGNEFNVDIEANDAKSANSNSTRFLKAKSLNNIQCFKGADHIGPLKKEEKVGNDNVEIECVKQWASKGRKGLSVYSKHSLKSENNDKRLCTVVNSINKKAKITPSQVQSSERKIQREEINVNTIVKKKSISPFMTAKQSFQFDRIEKTPNEAKAKSQLSRTNIRDFFVSKRIHR